jgi:hypothetical protein
MEKSPANLFRVFMWCLVFQLGTSTDEIIPFTASREVETCCRRIGECKKTQKSRGLLVFADPVATGTRLFHRLYVEEVIFRDTSRQN